MSTIQPQGESVRNAIRYISEKRQENPDMKLSKLIDDASFRYDLSPKDSEFLIRFFKESGSTPAQ